METIEKIPPDLEPKYLSLIEGQGLDPERFTHEYREKFPQSKYHPEYCDEDPLYTRYSQIDFLLKYDIKIITELLISMAINLWRETEGSLSQRRTPYMHFISLWEWEEEKGEYPCPYFFFCGSGIDRIRESLRLLPPSEKWSLIIQGSLCKSMGEKIVQVFEDRETQPGMVRLLIDFNTLLLANPYKITIESAYNSYSNAPNIMLKKMQDELYSQGRTNIVS